MIPQKEQIVLKNGQHAATRRVLFEIDETSYDSSACRRTRPPQAVRESQLVDASGWVPVDAATLQTRHPGCSPSAIMSPPFASPTRMFLPKAGVFADGQATARQNVAAEIAGSGTASQFNLGTGSATWRSAVAWPRMAQATSTVFRVPE